MLESDIDREFDIEFNAEHKCSVMVDSGAYSEWVKGEPTDIPGYIDFVKRKRYLGCMVVNYDIIPGRPGVPRTQDDVEESAKASYENLQLLKSHGIDAVPVFHQGERVYWLEKLLADGEPYIGISPMADLPTPTVRRWLDIIFTRLTNEDGTAIVKTHGFGMTAFALMRRYPWFSVDSATWAFLAAYGTILVPQFVANNPRFDLPPYKIIMSGIPRKQKSESFAQFETLGPTLQDCIRRYLREHIGVSLTQAIYDDRARRCATAYFMRRYGEECINIRFIHRLTGVLE